MNLQEFIYADHFAWDPEELSENLSYEIVQQMMELPEPEEIDFFETEKGRNALRFPFNNADANQRGKSFFRENKDKRPVCPPDPYEDEGNDVFISINPEEKILSINPEGKNKLNGKAGNPFICDGMTVVISKNGKTGAVSFNLNYLGKKIIKE